MIEMTEFELHSTVGGVEIVFEYHPGGGEGGGGFWTAGIPGGPTTMLTPTTSADGGDPDMGGIYYAGFLRYEGAG